MKHNDILFFFQKYSQKGSMCASYMVQATTPDRWEPLKDMLLEDGRSLLGLGWWYSLLVLELIRDKDRLFRSQKLTSLYKKNRCINLIKQELRRKPLLSCPAVGDRPVTGSLFPLQP
jgi:hypothetical protein